MQSQLSPPYATDVFNVLVYTSHQTRQLNDQDLENILIKSIANNQATKITGVLLYNEGLFCQFLEGPGTAISAIAQTIRKDPRHSHFTVLYEGKSKERTFEFWSMALFQPRKSDLLNLINEQWQSSTGPEINASNQPANHPLALLKGLCKANHMLPTC